MIDFIIALKTAFKTLLKRPKLFFPKIIIAALYSVQLLFLPSLTIEAFAAPSLKVFSSLIFWLVYLFVVMTLDILASAMYPFLVKDFFEKKEISLQQSLRKAFKKFFLVVATVFIVMLIFFAAVIALTFPLNFFLLTNNDFGVFLIAFISLAIVFLLGVFFYMIYPVLTLEKAGIFSSMKKSFSLSKKNFSLVSKATGFSMGLSLLSFALAFAIEFSSTDFLAGSLAAFLLFVLVRFATALIATYQYVLNPVFYLEIIKGGKLNE